MLTDELRAALEKRLTIIAKEQADDPIHQDLPRVDYVWLVLLLIACCLAVPLWQLWRVS
jgi:hypothetical protein